MCSYFEKNNKVYGDGVGLLVVSVVVVLVVVGLVV